MTKCKKMTINELQRTLLELNTTQRRSSVGGSEDWYTWDQAEAMMNYGTWTGGYVDDIGYVAAEVIVYGSSGSSNSFIGTVMDLWINTNPWLKAGLSDVIGIAYTPAGYALTGGNLVYDFWQYYNGNMSGELFTFNMAIDLWGQRQGGSIFGTSVVQSALLLNEFKMAADRYVNNLVQNIMNGYW